MKILAKKQTAQKGVSKKYSIWYDVVIAIELVLYGGFAIFVVAKIFPADYVAFAGIIFSGISGYILWRTNLEIFDCLIKMPLWVHWFAISMLTGLFITGKMFVSKLIPPSTTNAT